MWEVFNMGCGFVAIVPADRADEAVAVVGARHPGAARIGSVTGDGGRVAVAGVSFA
jgi:phosphoribosylformylglycinamidine cyclo-ligase